MRIWAVFIWVKDAERGTGWQIVEHDLSPQVALDLQQHYEYTLGFVAVIYSKYAVPE